ncbi:MAG: styrene monooxygenase/indole monooxygenase family protein [Solirubrobacteraceae bacterium]
MSGIAVVGAGVGGLHLGLLLQQREVPVTLYAERPPEEMLGGPRLMNTAGHWVPTRERERELGINHWDDVFPQVAKLNVQVTGEQPLAFSADLGLGPIAVDYRVSMARLLEDFVERGGEVVYGPVARESFDDLSEKHDLLVISSGRGTMTELFPRIPERSPYTRPQRVLQISACKGVKIGQETGTSSINYEFNPGVGELLLFPYLTADGLFGIVYISAAADGPLPALLNADLAGHDDREGINAVFRNVVEGYFPWSEEHIDWDEFTTVGPRYDIAGAITPTVRRPYAQLDNGRWVMALGDVHTVNDPLLGQGSNSASACAFILGDAIVEDPFDFDELWCERVAARMWERASGAVGFTNTLLQVPPAPQVVEVLATAAFSEEMAETVGSFFGNPVRARNVLATPARTRNAIKLVAGEPVLDNVMAALGAQAA